MSLTVQLLGPPRIAGRPDGGYQMRSRKSWALLAYLLLSDRSPTRAQLAGLLFDSADDPLGALRWSLTEIRRALGDGAVLEGDPVTVTLPPGAVVDVDVLTAHVWTEAVALPTLGARLLEGVTIPGAPAFESWLLSEEYRVGAATEQILHEAALGSLSRGAVDDAIRLTVRLVQVAPTDENAHALLIRLYRLAGNSEAAQRQFAACTDALRRELRTAPGAVVHAALRESRLDAPGPVDLPSVRAALESGRAAVSAGAVQTGADSLRAAVRLADRIDHARLRVESRLVLAETLIHSLRGFDEEGLAALRAADDIAAESGDRTSVAEARAELGYVDFLRGRYDRAGLWLTQALEHADGAPLVAGKATIYLGAVASDQGRYSEALRLLTEGVALSGSAGDMQRAAWGLTMIGRAHLLRGEWDASASRLDEALLLATEDHWLSFLAWPQALRGEVELARGDVGSAAALLEQAFARACQLNDPCWEGMSARGLALIAAVGNDSEKAFSVLADARRRADRLADPYVWLDGYILDAQCTLGRRYGHPETLEWATGLNELASRSGMRELHVRALLHLAGLGRAGEAAAARLLIDDIDNPALRHLAS